MTQRKIALSIEEAADYTGIGRNTLRQLVEWKKLPVLKVGRKVLIKTDILEMFMEANEGRDLRDSCLLYTSYPCSKILNAQLLSVNFCFRFVVTISYILFAFF